MDLISLSREKEGLTPSIPEPRSEEPLDLSRSRRVWMVLFRKPHLAVEDRFNQTGRRDGVALLTVETAILRVEPVREFAREARHPVVDESRYLEELRAPQPRVARSMGNEGTCERRPSPVPTQLSREVITVDEES